MGAKTIMAALLLFLLLSAGLSVSFGKESDALTVQICIKNPEKAVNTADTIIDKVTDSITDSISAPAKIDSTKETTIYRIRRPDGKPESQIGAYSTYSAAVSACQPGYCIFDEAGKLIWCNQIQGGVIDEKV